MNAESPRGAFDFVEELGLELGSKNFHLDEEVITSDHSLRLR